ncbi:MAG TPA: hypothetical protein VFX35_10270 [Solirubrobacterales bacterium]|nr:hypothetical protein [Solirubrobacterales bacterium]
MKQIRKRLTYANVMSSIAVFLVLGGATAIAAGQLGKNTVGSKQLKKNAVTTAKIKKEAVTGAKIKKGTITGANVNLGSLGKVPSAANADHAGSADSANTAKTATSADTANTAKNATGLSGPLAANQTLVGHVSSAGRKVAEGNFIDEAALTFQIPLATAPTGHFVPEGVTTPECPGSAEDPTAAPGNLCIYTNLLTGATDLDIDFVTRFGASVFLEGLGAAPVNYEFQGVWAVTAP